VPAKVQVLRHRRVNHACPGCEQCVKSTPLPEQILAKTTACAGLLAHLVTSKDVDSLATIAKTNRIRPCWPREAVERQSSAAVTAANVADHQSRDPFGCMHLTPDKLQNSQV
jgi:transposase